MRVEIPAELVRAAGWDTENLSAEAVAVLALELYRHYKFSLGRAAELCQMSDRAVHGIRRPAQP